MAPNPHKLTLSKDAFAPSNEAQSTVNEYPEEVKLVISGSAGAKAIDSLAVNWKKDGFGMAKGKTALTGIIYELGQGEAADPTMEAFSVASETPGNIALTLIHPLVGGVNAKLPPPDSAPQHAYICFSLPTITKEEQLQGENEGKWLAMFKEASERKLTLELALDGDESVHEAVEKLLGKAWDEEAERAKENGEDVNSTGVRIIFDALASTPRSHASSQLHRSKELENWSDFIRRLALHPRVFLKISPLPVSSLLPNSLSTPLRSADAPASLVPSVVAGAAHSAADVAMQAINVTETLTTSSPQERRKELLRRLRIFLDTALEAFGEERLVWAAYMGTGSASVSSAAAIVDKEALSEVEEWFEICRESLASSGLNRASLTNIFAK
ncbi:hypothetical protein CBS101457_006868 [Exobasidium rhododendri]|nr:hypothetical protein CBS101457_006868 [Exobasidium rhododendri]